MEKPRKGVGEIRATEYKLSGGWMVLNIESCSEGREEEMEEEEGRGSSSRNWMGSRASVLLGKREGERAASSHWGR